MTSPPAESATRAEAFAAASSRADALLGAFAALDDAAAVGEPDGGRVLGTTPRLRAVSPHAARAPDWAGLLAALRRPDARGGDGAVPGAVLEERTLPDGLRLLRVRPTRRDDPDLQRYLAERDDLFLTSRTLSVSEMATTLAHELNQPIGTLANLLAGLKLRLRRGALDAAGTEGVVDRALQQTRFAEAVIVRIREFTQARRPQARTLDARALAHRSVELLDWLMTSSGTRVELCPAAEPVRVRGDATLLQQVLVNLLRNAVDAMRDRPAAERVVSVSVEAASGWASIAVRDRGPGLGLDADSLFVPFATSKPDGMGVGLNICRSFLELHQGRLWLASAADGCTAHVELPLADGAGIDDDIDDDIDDGETDEMETSGP